jgi:hypothetical protein
MARFFMGGNWFCRRLMAFEKLVGKLRVAHPTFAVRLL